MNIEVLNPQHVLHKQAWVLFQTAVVPQNNGAVFTGLLTELFKSGAPAQQDAVGGNQPKIFAAKSTNPDSYSWTQISAWLVETASVSWAVVRAPSVYRTSTNKIFVCLYLVT